MFLRNSGVLLPDKASNLRSYCSSDFLNVMCNTRDKQRVCRPPVDCITQRSVYRHLILIRDLLNDAFTTSDYLASERRMILNNELERKKEKGKTRSCGKNCLLSFDNTQIS